MKTPSIHLVGAAWLVAATLAACGGGSAGDPPPADPAAGNRPPASASASTPGMVAYAAALAASANDIGEPVDLSRYALPPDPSDAAAAVATPIDRRGP